MKNKFLKIAKSNGCAFHNYNTYISDMGFRCYKIEVMNSKNETIMNFEDGYPIGSSSDHLLNLFGETLSQILS